MEQLLLHFLGPRAWWNVAAWVAFLATMVGYALGRVPFLPAMVVAIAVGSARRWQLRCPAPHTQGDRA